jgi:hypothetical protein
MAGDLRVTAIEKNGTKLLFALHGDGFAFEDGALSGSRLTSSPPSATSSPTELTSSSWSHWSQRNGRTPQPRRHRAHRFVRALPVEETTLAAGSDAGASQPRPRVLPPLNGGKIGPRSRSSSGTGGAKVHWISSARRILLRCGRLDPPAYVRRVNESLETYWKSPVRNEPNTRIAADFWKRRDVADLPYRRGDLVALLLDHEIRATSDGARSLDDLFREILRRAHESGDACSTDRLLELAADETSDDLAGRLRRLIVDGADVELPDDLGAPFCELQRTKAKRRAARRSRSRARAAPRRRSRGREKRL